MGSLNASERTTAGLSTTRGGKVKWCAILPPAGSEWATSLPARLCCPEEGMECTWGRPALMCACRKAHLPSALRTNKNRLPYR